MEIANLRFGYKNRDMLTEFAGYDHNKRISSNYFYDMRNMSGRYKPCLAPRARRGRIDTGRDSAGPPATTASMHACRGMIAKDKLYWIDDNNGTLKFYCDGTEIGAVSAELDNTAHEKNRQLISMGAYIVIFPDKIRYNTLSAAGSPEIIPLEQKISISNKGNIHIQITREDGSTYLRQTGSWTGANARNTFVQDTTPTSENRGGTDLKSGDYWIDLSGERVSLKTYSTATGMWSSVPTTFVKISHALLSDGDLSDPKPLFKAGDAITISGFYSEELKQFNSTMYVNSAGVEDGKGWIVVTGLINAIEQDENTANKTISFRRLCPEMDFVCESKNRIWGCHYGKNNDGSVVNEIYACALGDPTNWYRFTGIASDSYYVELGTDGAFTGIAAYDDQILFFKEKYIHKIFGTKPSNFQATFSTTNGIREDCERSAVVLNETLYYLSKNGVMAYSGGTPASLHAPFAEQRFKDAVAGAVDDKYYICMTETGTNERALWCFDVGLQCWYKEDEADITHFATLKENIFAASENELAVLNAETYDYEGLTLEDTEKAVEWFAETGDIGLVQDDEKYYSDFQIRFECEAGSEIRIAFMYDDNGKWVERFAVRNDRRRAYNIPFVTPRCDHMRIKFFGRGKVIVYGISKYYEGGGEITRG